MIGHLGPRVGALLDGRLPAHEEERAWAHVDQCGTCRDEVRRHGWVKTRLAGLSHGGPDTGALKTALLAAGPPPSGAQLLDMSSGLSAGSRSTSRTRHRPALAALGTGAAGVVALGMLAVVAPPADAPVRQPPTARPATPGPVVVPIRLRDQP